MKKNYVYKVNATGQVFNDLQSAVNDAALSLYQSHKYNHRISDPVAVKRNGGYTVYVFDLYGRVYKREIDVFVPATFTKKGKQIKIDGLNSSGETKYSQFFRCEWGSPAEEENKHTVTYDDEYDHMVRCDHCGAIFDECIEGDYNAETGEVLCDDCLKEYEDEKLLEDEDEGDE